MQKFEVQPVMELRFHVSKLRENNEDLKRRLRGDMPPPKTTVVLATTRAKRAVPPL